MATTKDILYLLRPHQYLKNLFIFAPVLFAARVTEAQLLLTSLLAFACFSLTASGVYVFNDLRDREADREHPKKRNRPIASGAVSPGLAAGLTAGLLAAGLGLCLVLLPPACTVWILVYIGLNLLYSLKLKHVPLLDVSIIALGFVLRLFVGSAATGIELSAWIILTTFLLALFLALAKRRDDEIIYLETGKRMRQAGAGYNLEFINVSLGIMAAVVVVAYTMYTLTPSVAGHFGTDKIYLSVIFVVLGILRYLQLTFVYKDSGSPTRIVLKDRFLQAVILCWGAFFVAVVVWRNLLR
jgi:4-hydroxybenzoate polyprenyltransferase